MASGQPFRRAASTLGIGIADGGRRTAAASVRSARKHAEYHQFSLGMGHFKIGYRTTGMRRGDGKRGSRKCYARTFL